MVPKGQPYSSLEFDLGILRAPENKLRTYLEVPKGDHLFVWGQLRFFLLQHAFQPPGTQGEATTMAALPRVPFVILVFGSWWATWGGKKKLRQNG